MGMNLNYFYSLTPRQFFNTVKGYNQRKEVELLNGWEQVRKLAFYNFICNPQIDKKNKDIKPQEFMPFPWEEQLEEKPKPAKKLIKNTFELWDKLKFEEKK